MNTKVFNFGKVIKISVVILFLIVVFGIFKEVKASSGDSADRKFICQSVKIEKKDTLWSIAEDYYSNEYDDIADYVEAIKEANNLKSDTIHAGNYIIVPYYTD